MTDLNKIPLLVEVARETYKSRLGSKGATRSADPQHLEYILPGDRLLTVDLHYVDCDSPTGFPYHRLTCKMQLDGKRITKAQLHDLCTSELPMSRNYQNHPELYPEVADQDPDVHYLKHMTPDCTYEGRIRTRIRLLTTCLNDANRTDCFEEAKSLERQINQLRRQLSRAHGSC